MPLIPERESIQAMGGFGVASPCPTLTCVTPPIVICWSKAIPPIVNQDYDANNDGILDSGGENWSILDGIGYLDGNPSDIGYAPFNFAYNGKGVSTNTLASLNSILPGYFARIGNSTGSAPADWLASHVTGTNPANFKLTIGATTLATFGGLQLDHIGSVNPTTGRDTGPFDLGNGYTLNQMLLNDDDNSGFGRNIDVDAGAAVVSCEFCNQKAAFVYEYDGSVWSQVAKLTPSTAESGGSFGRSVAIDGDVVIVGNVKNRVYVFEKPAGGWSDMTETAILSSNDPLATSFDLGETVDIDGNTILAYEREFQQLLIFEKGTTNWVAANETATITGTNTYNYTQFGRGAEVRGDIILTPLDGDIPPSAMQQALPGFVFVRPSGGWVDTDIDQSAVLLRDSANQFLGVPYDAYLSDNHAFLSYQDNSVNSLRVHVYQKPAGGWGSLNATGQDIQEPIAYLEPSGTGSNRFGFSIAGDGDEVLYVGDYDASNRQGQVEVFMKSCAGNWQTGKPAFILRAPDRTDDDQFGRSLRVNNDGQLLVTADQLTAGGKNDVGGFYAFDRLPGNSFQIAPSDVTLLSANDQAGALVRTNLQAATTSLGEQPTPSTNGSTKVIEASDQRIYGVSRTGDGYIYRSFADGRNFEVIHQFTGTGAGGNGRDPQDLIELSDGRLCGITVGDASGTGITAGTVFVVDKDGSNFSNLWTFDATTFLISPVEVFQASNDKIYVSFAFGQLYRLNTDGSDVTALATTTSLDSHSLVELNGKLYGRSRFSGTNNLGKIFSVDLATDNVTILHDLTAANGHGQAGGLVIKGNLIYGTNNEGGANNRGTAFVFDLATNQYSVIHDFPSSAAATFRKDLTLTSDGNIYGLTDRGSSSIFRIHTGLCRVDTAFTYSSNGSVSSNFVEIINTPPTLLGAVADTTVLEDAANITVDLSTVFMASDEPASYLTPTAVGSDTTLFDSLSIDLGILTVDLAANASGQSTVTLRATDSRGAFVETDFTITVNPVIDGQPNVDTVFTMVYGDLQTRTNAIITGPNVVDGSEVTHFQLTEYNNLRLFKADGTTEIPEDSFIDVSEDSLRLLPLAVGPASFKVQAATNGDNASLGGSPATVRGTVSQRNLVITGNDTTIAYGETLPAFDGTLAGIANPSFYTENITVNYNTSATGDSVGTFTIVPTINDPDNRLPNYTLTTNDGMLTVEKGTLVVTPNNVSTTYGSSLPILSGTLAGVVNSDSIVAVYSTDANADSIGTYSITATLQDPDNRLRNYEVTNNTGQLTIDPAVLTVEIADTSRIYGREDPAFTFQLTGFVNGEDASEVTTQPLITSSASVTSDVGTYAISGTGATATNYTFQYVEAVLTISQATLTVTANDQVRSFANANPALTLSFAGFLNGDDIDDLDTAPSASTTAAANSTVGTYPIEVAGGSDNNYAFNYVAGTLTVTKATAAILFEGLEQIADGSPKEPKVTTDPLDLKVLLTYNGDTIAPSAAGEYQILATIDELNYQGTDSATFTLSEANVLSVAFGSNLAVYPSPASESLWIRAPKNSQIQITDLRGSIWLDVKIEATSTEQMVDVSQWPRGVYLVSISSGGGHVKEQAKLLVR